MLPAHTNNINRRALGQSGRYITARSKAQQIQDVVQVKREQDEIVSSTQAENSAEHQKSPEEQESDAAKSLVEVARQQQQIGISMNTETISINTGSDSDADASIAYSRRCPVTTCEDHMKCFSSKADRDRHTMTHFNGQIKCGVPICSRWDDVFETVEHLKNHLRRSHLWAWLDPLLYEDYLEHLDDCVVRMVELQASAKATGCPMSSCLYHHVEFSSKYRRD